MFVMLKEPWCLSLWKGYWCLQYWKGLDICNTESVLIKALFIDGNHVIYVVILKCLDIRIYIYRLVCSHNRKGFEVYYMEKDLMFVILKRPWCLSYWNGLDVCHTERALMFIIIERALMFVILKEPWCLSYWKGIDVYHTERALMLSC